MRTHSLVCTTCDYAPIFVGTAGLGLRRVGPFQARSTEADIQGEPIVGLIFDQMRSRSWLEGGGRSSKNVSAYSVPRSLKSALRMLELFRIQQ
jgi:hypothetical protein